MQVTFKKSDFHGHVHYSETWLTNGSVAFRKVCIAPKLRPHCATPETLAAFFGGCDIRAIEEDTFDTLCAKPPYALTLKRTGLLWEKTGGLARLYMTASGPARGAWFSDRFIAMLDNPDELVGQDELSPFAVVEDKVAVAVLMRCRQDDAMVAAIIRAGYMMRGEAQMAVT